MPARRVFSLSDADAAALQQFVQTGTKAARAITRARILLLSAGDTHTVDQICATLGVCPATVYNIRSRYQDHGLTILQDAPRSGQPRKVTPQVEAQITTIACSSPPDGRVRWTLQLLTDRLVDLYGTTISDESVRHVLKKVA